MMKIEKKLFLIFVLLFLIGSASLQFLGNELLSNSVLNLGVLLLIIILIKKKSYLKIKKSKFKIGKIELFYLFAYTLIALLTIWNLLFKPGLISLIHDWSVPPYDFQIEQKFSRDLFIWKEFGLGVNINYYSSHPFNLFLSLTGLIGFNGELFTKAYLIFVLALSGFSLMLLSKHLFGNKKFSFISGLLYMLNPYTFSRVIAGYVYNLFSYSLMPLIILLYSLSLRDKKVKYALLAGLLFGFSISQIQFVFIVPAALIAYTFFTDNKPQAVKRLGLVLLIGLLMHLNWILPLLQDLTQVQELDAGLSFSIIRSLNTPVAHSLILVGSSFSYLTAFVQKTPIALLWMINAFLMAAFLLWTATQKVKKEIIGIGLLSFLIILLIQSSINIPFFRTLFRDAHYLLAIPALFYALLSTNLLLNLKKKINEKVLITLSITIMIIYSFPFFTGDYGRFLKLNHFSEEYSDAYHFLNNDTSDSRALWLPMIHPLSYDNNTQGVNDPFAFFSPKPALIPILNINKDSDGITAFLNYNLYNNITIDNLLKKLNIKHVVLRRNFESNFSHYSDDLNYNNENLFDYFKDSKAVFNTENITIYELDYNPHFYASKKIKLSNGNLSELNNDYDTIFLRQNSESVIGYFYPNETIAEDNSINLTKYVDGVNASINWVDAFNYWWENKFISYSLNQGIYTNSNKTLTIEFNDTYNISIEFYGNATINNVNYSNNELKKAYFNSDDLIIKPINELFINEVRTLPEPVLPESFIESNCEINYTKVSSTKYLVSNECAEPFFLIFSESYDSSWKATLNGGGLPHFQANAFANAYFINETGTITIEYEKQTVYFIGITVFLFMIFFIPAFSLIKR